MTDPDDAVVGCALGIGCAAVVLSLVSIDIAVGWWIWA